MPYDFDTQKRSFRSNGKYISRRETREKIDKLLDFVKKEAARIGRRFNEGKINAAEFNVAMRELLKAGHIVSSTVGRGGREMMQAVDWGRVGAKLQWQYGFLDKLTRKLESGATVNAEGRAKQYVNSIYVSYADSYMETNREFIESGGDNSPNGEILCRLVTNSKEGCVECAADEALDWIPVSEMGEIGTRICGDFCLCDIEFDDV